MIILSKDKVDERYNIDDDGVITDLNGNVQKTYLTQGRPTFKGQSVHKIQMWTKYGWRDGRIWHIHHIDGNKLNNNINNLEYLKQSEHTKLHHTGKKQPHSEETKKKISESLKGHHHSVETKQKLSEANKGKNNAMYGKHFKHSEETNKKISENHSHYWKDREFSEEHKKKLSEKKKNMHWKINPETGKRIWFN